MTELDLLADADARARAYVAGAATRRAFPDAEALAALGGFDEPLPTHGAPPEATLALLDRIGSPATVASNGPRYFGFVKGASLPVAAAAERLVLAWDQSAASAVGAPSAAAIERVAGRWIADILDLPRDSAVGFGTSASACTIGCLTAARRTLLARLGWNFDAHGLDGAPPLRVVISETAHITVKKALRLLGFGLERVVVAPVDGLGRVDPARLPMLDDRTILCLQAGEVNTGSFDPFATILPVARAAGAWVHVDGAFGLWARAAAASRPLTEGVELADSWTTDGHKWLNTPYDGAMGICRDPGALAAAMNSDAAYATAEPDAQKNLTLEFSRRARGVAIWAAVRSLGREGVAAMVDRHRAQAKRLAEGLAAAGFEILNDVVLNQVLIRAASPAETEQVRRAAEASGEIWFGPTIWQGAPAARLSVCSWRTTDADIDRAVDLLASLLRAGRQS
ncbi:pyridoxal-dependent decarboxylase [Sphingomonas sp.]|uniref:pyridoxal phosphate-dependent decarboxylase family protein n=1 Tax=Sphingomonas sp. TaxID=28214 RepID=UPI001DC68D7E|nr:pyridoxal-dependent decarboxylase [Sphingomonas sp.]MBX9797765.1 hypothetical protein [Sphingomonas sp.]